jgi:hypothetical protein
MMVPGQPIFKAGVDYLVFHLLIFSHSPFICAREETHAENTRKTDTAGISGVSL